MEEHPTRAHKSERSALWKAFGLAWEFGYLIIVPLLLFSLGGLWLDRHFGTKPWLFLTGMVVAIITTTLLLVRKFSEIIKDIDDASTPASGTPNASNG